MLHLPPIFVKHLAKAVEYEVSILEKLDRSLGPCGEWPDDYDPNDLTYYRGALVSLAKSVEGGMKIEDPSTKPVEALMRLIPYYARTNRHSISDDDLALAYRVYADYVASVCLIRLPQILESKNSSYLGTIRRMLSSLIEFPKPGGS